MGRSERRVRIVGAGLAGCEAALFLARRGVEVALYDLKPSSLTEAHRDRDSYAELVCSNSLKSDDPLSAPGILKAEMEALGSVVMEAGVRARVPSGQDLAVDRSAFSRFISEKVKAEPRIHLLSQDVTSIPDDGEIAILATGPLTSKGLSDFLVATMGRSMLSFYDAAAPLIFHSSLDTSAMVEGSRYGKGEGKYLNIPLSQERYIAFCNALTQAKRIVLHDFEHFEGCLPLEVMAQRGIDTLRHGPLKAVGLPLPEGTYAAVQLRRDDAAGSLYGPVGFQTNLTFSEQKRVFGLLPGLENAKYARFGLMHRNTYVNAPAALNRDLSLKARPDLFVAGQLTGVEGYCESAAMGLLAASYVWMRLKGTGEKPVPANTMIGSLANYLAMSSPERFAPMNATFGILYSPHGKKDKALLRKEALEALGEWIEKSLKA